MREDTYAYIGGIMRRKKATLLAAGGMFDHIHLYASLPSIISIADFVNAVKANSSRWVHDSSSADLEVIERNHCRSFGPSNT